MGLDKLRLISRFQPRFSFLEVLELDLHLPLDQSKYDIQISNPERMLVERTRCSVSTRKGIQPAFFLQLNYFAFKQGLVHILEVNPNKLPEGNRDLEGLIEAIFGPCGENMRVSRIDPNADVQVSVDYFYRTLRVPLKRKSSRYLEAPAQREITFSNRGMTGFTIGASPSFLRVYNKREEMKRRRENIEGLPRVLTRFEWELRHRKCPVGFFRDLPKLLQYEPFADLQILRTSEAYDFHTNPKDSLKRFSFNELAKKYGSHEAAKIMNSQRNFKRDFTPFLLNSSEIKRELQRSYLEGVQAFFNNQQADSLLRRNDHAGPSGYKGNPDCTGR